MAKNRNRKRKFSSSETVQAQENLKQLFLAGLGLADATNEKLQAMFNSLGSNRIRHPRVRKAVGDIKKRVFSRRKVLEKKFSEYFGKKELLRSNRVRKTSSKSEGVKKRKILKSKALQPAA